MRSSDMDDEQYAAEYSAIPPSVRAAWEADQGLDHDDDPDSDQDPEGFDYRVTVDFNLPTRLEAQMLADLVRDVVRRHEERVPCRACGGSKHVALGRWWGTRRASYRLCTACKDGTVVIDPAVVTFEALREVGSEALVGRFVHPSYSGIVMP